LTIKALIALLTVLAGTAAFFFATTRGALIARRLWGGRTGCAGHVYPIYSNMGLIKLIDWQPLVSGILLFQYRRMVSGIVAGLRSAELGGKNVLITSCAFGNVMPQCIDASVRSGAQRIVIADLIANELVHARGKLEGRHAATIDYVMEDATDMKLEEGFAHVNIMFFLLHELPHDLKIKALSEAGRMLASGGTLYLAEFHRPRTLVLRCLSWIYFKVFEPLGLSLWDSHDPVSLLKRMGGWTVHRQTFCFGNFQLVTATRL
jgi:SAM-dependent methyltransferase